MDKGGGWGTERGNTATNRLSTHYAFDKPNDTRALELMNAAAAQVVSTWPDVVVAYGVSDEYSFVLHRGTGLFERRAAKLVSSVVSAFTAAYVFLWGEYVVDRKLERGCLPSFDGRAVVYPGVGELRDYLCWRQVDCHINNLYNTTFWAMVQQGGMSTTEAEEELKGTLAADKNEILWSRYGINYNNEPEMFRKGSVVFREFAMEQTAPKTETELRNETTAIQETVSKTQQEKMKKAKQKARVVVEHLDIIKDEFWNKRPWILTGKPGQPTVDNK